MSRGLTNMSSVHGKAACTFLNGYDLSSFFRTFDLANNVETADTTAFRATDRTKIVGLNDGSLSLEGLFDAAAGGSDAVIGPLVGTGNDTWIVSIAGDTAGLVSYAFQSHITNYTITGAVDDVVATAVENEGRRAPERLINYHALSAETATGDGTAIDNSASTANGGSAYLVVTAGTGFGTFDLIIEESATGSFSGEETTLASFTQVTAANADERITFAGTVERHLRLSWTIVTATSVTFYAGINRA